MSAGQAMIRSASLLLCLLFSKSLLTGGTLMNSILTLGMLCVVFSALHEISPPAVKLVGLGVTY